MAINLVQGKQIATASWATNAVTSSYISPTFISASAAASGFGSGGGGSSNAGGSNTQIQFNSGSALAGTGSFTFNYRSQSLQQGLNVTASGIYSHAEGGNTIARGMYSHAEGDTTVALGAASHTEGDSTITQGVASHAEGAITQASGDYSHAEGFYNLSTGLFSHAEGLGTVAAGIGSKAEGIGVPAYDLSYPFENIFDAFNLDVQDIPGNTLINFDPPITSLTTLTTTGTDHTSTVTYPYRVPYLLINNYLYGLPYTLVLESATYNAGTGITTFTVSGLQQYYSTNIVDPLQYTLALGEYSHAEGEATKTYGYASHAEGKNTIASGSHSHAEGDYTEAIGNYSHAEGSDTKAIGNHSHAEGWNTIAAGNYQHVQGQFNISSSAQSAFIIGNGTNIGAARSNLVFASGNTFQITGSLNVSGSITGSLFGTASFATSASWAPNMGGSSVISVTGSTLYSTTPVAGPGFGALNDSSIFLGESAGQNATNARNSNFLGSGSGYLATFAANSNFLGSNAGKDAMYAQNSNFLGSNAGFNAINASHSNFMGSGAGSSAINAIFSNFFGANAGASAINASYSTLIGFQVGGSNVAFNSIGRNNIIIGTNITLPFQQRDSINLGGIIFATGSYFETESNSFSGSMPNAKVGIGTSTPQFTLDVSGSLRTTSNVEITGSLNVLGTTNIIGNGSVSNFMYANVFQAFESYIVDGGGNKGMNAVGGGTNIFTSNNNVGITFNSGSRSSNVRELMRITPSGSVGIGTSTPQYTLDVSGSTRINDILILQPRTTTPGTPTNGMIIVSGSGADQHIYCYLNSTWKQLNN